MNTLVGWRGRVSGPGLGQTSVEGRIWGRGSAEFKPILGSEFLGPVFMKGEI